MTRILLDKSLSDYITDETQRSMIVTDENDKDIKPDLSNLPEFEVIEPNRTKETALTVTKTSETEIKPSVRNYSLIEAGGPDEVIKRKHEIAKVLQDVINKRATGFEVNGVRTLNYEEWLMIAKMYSCFPRIVSTTYGLEKYSEICFEAVAEVVHIPTGNVIARAESMASKMEKGKDWFDLNKIRSLAQTRAGSKAMRMVFSDIAVLAGYSPTPLEEIDDMVKPAGSSKPIPGMIVS